MGQKAGTAATVSIVGAIAGYIVLFSKHPVWALVLSIVAAMAGLIGLIAAASPRVGGGIMSIVALILSAILLILSILGIIGAILF